MANKKTYYGVNFRCPKSKKIQNLGNINYIYRVIKKAVYMT